jgi:hypothetical protein
MKVFLYAPLIVFVLVTFGCGKKETPVEPAAKADKQVHEIDGWCVTHEVPENECSLCNSKVAAECKKNGDWCAEHDRAESQCFLCDPSRKESFVAKYEAQHGKKPPK